jgi:hypothetical protein
MGSFRDFCKRTTISEQEEPEMIEKPQTIRRVVEKRRANRMPRREEDVITESENMIATLQEKIEQVFYRFGLAGLERVDGAIINCVNEMLNPDGVTESVRPSRKTSARQSARAESKPAAKKPMTVREIAAAALRDMPPMDPDHEVGSGSVSESNADYEPPEPPSYEPQDPMAALEGEQLNAEERAMLQQALAEAGDETVAAPVHRDMSALSLAAKALQS